MLIDDDGYADWFFKGLPVLDSYGLKATMSIIAGLVGTNAAWATKDMLKSAYARGHELCTHGAAALNGELVIIMLHQIVGSGGPGVDVTIDSLEQVCRYIA